MTRPNCFVEYEAPPETLAELERIQDRNLRGINTPLFAAIPEHQQGLLLRYFRQRLYPGSCLGALLSGDSFRAVTIADEDTYEALPSILRWVAQYAPRESFGSPEKLARWMGVV